LLHASAVSDVGRVRKTNEDAFVADTDVSLFAVADGMGGHDAGEVASALAIEAISAFIRRSAGDTDFSWPYGIDRSLSYDANRLRTAIHLANRRIFRTAESNDDYNGMGTTIVASLVAGSRLSVGHVGDSRLYLVRRGVVRQLTEDDSWAATILAQDPRLNPADIAKHPMRNVLTNVLGARDHVDVHLSEHDLEQGDVVLLCSDGLHGVMDDAALAHLTNGQRDMQTAARQLVDAALERGSRDNVTALLIRYEGDAR
jgi:serine/threonine protein phosphatase PrpC